MTITFNGINDDAFLLRYDLNECNLTYAVKKCIVFLFDF